MLSGLSAPFNQLTQQTYEGYKILMQTQIKPLMIKSKLGSTPIKAPRYKRDLKLSSGNTVAAVDPKATRAMLALMDMQAVLGGAASHWGGPSAFAELMSALHAIIFHEAQIAKAPWYDLFNFVNDAGHCENGLYALKANYGFADLSLDSLKGFRSMTSPLSGHGEAHLFPEGVYLSNGPLGSALPQSEGLAAADHLTGHQRVTVTAISDGACMEGEAREALASIPGLAANGKMAPFVMIISDNNTKLSGRIDKDAFSMAPTFLALSALGWEVLDLHEAHDLEACAATIEIAIERARANPRIPVAIHARTVKGYGIKKTMEALTGGHGFPLKDPQELEKFLEEIYGEEKVPAEFMVWARHLEEEALAAKANAVKSTDIKVQVGVAKALIKKREEGLPLFSVTADLQGSTGVADFQKKFPESYQDVGVAESNMISLAAGLSKAGFIPVVDTFSQFGVTKGALPIWMANLSEAPIIAIFSHAGFQDAADGASHQALAYFSMVSAIPHTKVFALSTSDEAEALVALAIDEFAQARKQNKTPSSYIFFLGRENFPANYGANLKYQLGQAQVLFDNSKDFTKSVTIAAAGALVGQSLQAAKLLADKKIGAIVVNTSSINHPDVATFTTCLSKTGGRLITAEDHAQVGGMGAMLLQALSNNGIKYEARTLGVQDQFGQSAYNAIDLYKKHGLDAASIAAKASQLV
jgi:transketolase